MNATQALLRLAAIEAKPRPLSPMHQLERAGILARAVAPPADLQQTRNPAAWADAFRAAGCPLPVLEEWFGAYHRPTPPPPGFESMVAALDSINAAFRLGRLRMQGKFTLEDGTELTVGELCEAALNAARS